MNPIHNREQRQKIIKRVNSKRYLELGVPGFYEKFNYEDAIKKGLIEMQLVQEVKSRIADGLKKIMC